MIVTVKKEYFDSNKYYNLNHRKWLWVALTLVPVESIGFIRGYIYENGNTNYNFKLSSSNKMLYVPANYNGSLTLELGVHVSNLYNTQYNYDRTTTYTPVSIQYGGPDILSKKFSRCTCESNENCSSLASRMIPLLSNILPINESLIIFA